MMNIFIRAQRDFFSPFGLKLIVYPAALSVVLVGLPFWLFGGGWFDFFSKEFVVHFESSWLLWLERMVNFFIETSLVLLFVAAFLLASLVVNLVFCSFLAPVVVRHVHKRAYAHCLLEEMGFFEVMGFFLRYGLCYGFLLLCCVLLFFVPFAWWVGLLIVHYYLFSRLLLLDVGSNIFSQSAFLAFQSKKQLWELPMIVLYLLGFIPVLNFFVPYFALVLLAHICLDEKGGSGAN